jgi:RNA polymerase sigma-70 factor (ECF subfamily)
VQDDNTLNVDRNGNDDLTEDSEGGAVKKGYYYSDAAEGVFPLGAGEIRDGERTYKNLVVGVICHFLPNTRAGADCFSLPRCTQPVARQAWLGPSSSILFEEKSEKRRARWRRSARGCTYKGMSSVMSGDASAVSDLLQRAARGDEQAFQELLSRYRDRLKRMVHLRLSRRLQGRVDDSDVLQEAYLEVAKQLPEYVQRPALPFFLWLRHLTGLKLAEVHRRHLGTQLRDADREVTLHRGGLPEADSASLAAQLLGKLTTPSQAAIKAETRLFVQEALNSMDPIDREVLALKHFEQLSTSEIAAVLGLSKAGAGSRYLRALKRLREILCQIPGFNEL